MNKTFIEVLTEYSDYSKVFSAENIIKLPKNIRINDYTINLEENKQLPFGSIYSLGLIEFETLKTYIKTNLANSFIQSFKSPAKALILFDKKSDKSICLCVNYWGLNNLIIKKQYLLSLIGESLD